MLSQNNDEGKEVALYYIGRTLVGAEYNYYSAMEKFFLALIYVIPDTPKLNVDIQSRPLEVYYLEGNAV